MPNTNQTTGVSVTFTLYSSAAQPPYEVAGCAGTIAYNNNAPAVSFNSWNAQDIGTPQPNGADFTLMVADSSYSSFNNVTGVANWALTFIPRGATTQQSPFGNNQNTITGTGVLVNNNGVFTLLNSTSNVKIKNAGDWDWGLMIQMVVPNGAASVVKCFSSDPEMQVDS
jgi:hypothetical protein